MKTRRTVALYFGAGVLVVALLFDVLAQRHMIVKAAQTPKAQRAKHYSMEKRTPFTFVSRYTLTGGGLTEPMFSEVTVAEDSLGRRFRSDKVLTSFSTGEIVNESDTLIEPPSGRFTVLFSTKWQQGLHMPALTTSDTNPRVLTAHPRPEENCTPPEHTLSYMRNETLKIGGQDYEAAVVQTKSHNDLFGISWLALNPELGCLVLKTVDEYNSPVGLGRGTTVQEPVSLTLGEPDAQLMDLPARISGTVTETIPHAKWKAGSKSKTDEYKAEYQKLAALAKSNLKRDSVQ
jgi:hypothetical protein